jgi:hypothetical protein
VVPAAIFRGRPSRPGVIDPAQTGLKSTTLNYRGLPLDLDRISTGQAQAIDRISAVIAQALAATDLASEVIAREAIVLHSETAVVPMAGARINLAIGSQTVPTAGAPVNRIVRSSEAIDLDLETIRRSTSATASTRETGSEIA